MFADGLLVSKFVIFFINNPQSFFFVPENLQAEYIAEGLDVAAIVFRDNQTVVDLISKKPFGLMVILEDQVWWMMDDNDG